MELGTVQILGISMGLLGGLAIFLFGMDLMTTSLKTVAGGGMKRLLARITTNRFKAVFAGAFTTAVIQSSSVTTVLAVGFVAAGLMSLQQSIGIIMGAEIGTTITAQIIAFKITKFALLAVTIGFGMYFFSKDEKIKQYGLMILGFGLVFFGMHLMGEATHPLRSYEPFIHLLQRMDNPLFAVLLSATFTALIQSSSATTGVIIVLASQGLITLEQGIALVFGANIGTSITAILASIGKPRDAVRTALIHVSFNVLGVTLWFNFIPQVADVIRSISPVAADLQGAARLAAETPRQIANAHTMFNVGNTMIFIWFTPFFAWLVTRLVPKRPKVEPEIIRPKYLDDLLLDTPTLAFDRVRMEIGRLAGQVLPMVRNGPQAIMKCSEVHLRKLQKKDDNVDILHGAIVTYLGKLSREYLTTREIELLHDYMAISGYYENIGDTLETNLVHTGMERIRNHVVMSEPTQKILGELADKVYWSVEQATQAVTRSDIDIAQQVIAAKPEVNQLVDSASSHLEARLAADDPHRLSTFRVESELIENLKHVYYFAKRIAKVVTVIDVKLNEDERQLEENKQAEDNGIQTPSS